MPEVDDNTVQKPPHVDDPFGYRTDLYAWSRSQTAALRQLARRRDVPGDLDIENIVEEIGTVGGSQLAAVESFLRLIVVHLMKAASAQSEGPKLHWRSEVIGFHNELVSRYTTSMGKDIDLDRIWARAFRQARAALQDYGEEIAPGLKRGCPFELRELTAEELEPDVLVVRVSRLASGSGLR